MLKPDVKLYPFQEEGVRFLISKNGCGILGDEPGLGKSIQSISFTSRHNFKTLIICPAYLKYNWINEITKFTTNTADIMTKNHVPNTDYIIVNYEMVHTVADIIPTLGFDCAILDESQYLMNFNSKRTTVIYPLLLNIPRKILLSGTPIKNRAEEYFSQLNIVYPGFCDKKIYMSKFVEKRLNLKNSEVDHIKLNLLNQLLKEFMIRHRKCDVLKDLPSKVFQIIPVDVPSATLAPLNGLNGLEYITKAKQLLSKAKIADCIKMIKDHMDQDSKVIVFSQHIDNLHELYAELKDHAVLHYGEIALKQRQLNIERFQTDPNCKVLIGNTATAVGYTATAADTVIFLDLPWSPSDMKQAEDRAHRIGQKNSVNVKYLIARGTLDEQILKLLQAKEKILLGSLDGIFSNESLNIKDELLKILNMKPTAKEPSAWGKRPASNGWGKRHERSV